MNEAIPTDEVNVCPMAYQLPGMEMGSEPSPGLVTGNHYDKYSSRNPLARWLVDGFLAKSRQGIELAAPRSILDVGCADGKLASLIIPDNLIPTYLGFDISPAQIIKAATAYPQLRFQQASAYALPVESNTCDMVLALEILEHLERPQVAVTELARVTRRWALVSVPWEPVWRALNLVRGAYVRQLGNTPGHLQHFTRSSIRQLVNPAFRIVQEFHPLPWTILLLEKL